MSRFVSFLTIVGAVGLIAAACGGGGQAANGGGGGSSVSGGRGGGAAAAGHAGTDGAAGTTVGVGGNAGVAGAIDGGLPIGVVAESGGTLTEPAGAITVTIPAGALLGPTTFFLSPAAGPPPSADYVPIAGASFRLDWTGAGFVDDATIGVRIPLGATAKAPPDDDTLLAAGNDSPLAGVLDCPDGFTYSYANSSGGPNANNSDGNNYENAALPISCTPPASGGGGTGTGGRPGGSGQAGRSGSQGGGGGWITISVVSVNGSAFPTITKQPSSIYTCKPGDYFYFEVTATGAAPLTYEWRRNKDPVGTGVSYGGFGIDAGEMGATYTVVVSNKYGFRKSDGATIKVDPPAPFSFRTPAASSGFEPDVGPPEVGSLGGLSLIVWSQGATMLMAYGSGSGHSPFFQPTRVLNQPARGRPRLAVADGELGGYLVFVDDDGTGSCAAPAGNRLSAIALRATRRMENPTGALEPVYPLSERHTLYQAAGDCITQFSAALADDYDVTSKELGVVFGLLETTSGELRTGRATATFAVASDPWAAPLTGSWSWRDEQLAPPVFDTDCAGPLALGPDAIATPIQSFGSLLSSVTTALLAVTAGTNVCTARLVAGGTGWTMDGVLFDHATGAPPVAAVDYGGNLLVVGNRVEDPAAAVLIHHPVALFHSASEDFRVWSQQVLDTAPVPSAVSAAFDGLQHAYVVWRPNVASGAASVYGAVHVPTNLNATEGVWGSSQRLSAATAVAVGEPRVCAGSSGGLAVYAQTTDAAQPARVVGSRWYGGLWSAPGPVHAGIGAGGDPSCTLEPIEVAWRESDPNDAAVHRIAESSASKPVSSQCSAGAGGAGGAGGVNCAQGIALGSGAYSFPPPGGVGRRNITAIAAGPDGNLWFTEDPYKIGRVTPAGVMTEFPVDGRPGAITAGPGGNLWFVEYRDARTVVGALSTQGVLGSTFDIGSWSPGEIAAGADGNLWVGSSQAQIHRVTPTGALTTFATPAPVQSIAAGPDGNIWATTADSRILTITPAGNVTARTVVSTLSARLSSITAGPDGALWFTEGDSTSDPAAYKIGRITPAGVITKFPVCGRPLAITAGGDGNLWFTIFPKKIGRITTAGVVTEFTITVGSGNFLDRVSTIASVGSRNDVWFLDFDRFIGQLTP